VTSRSSRVPRKRRAPLLLRSALTMPLVLGSPRPPGRRARCRAPCAS